MSAQGLVRGQHFIIRYERNSGQAGDPVPPTRVPEQKLRFPVEELRHMAEFIIS
jgi:hypothetical protein